MGLFLNPARRTSANRVLLALVCGVMTGAGLFCIPLIVTLFSSQTLEAVAVVAFQVLVQPLLFIAYWTIALVMAAPGWWLLHRLGARSQATAVLYAGALAFVTVLAILTEGFDLIPSRPGSSYSASSGGIATVIDDHVTAYGWVVAAKSAAIVAAMAGVVGWVTAWVAYRRPNLRVPGEGRYPARPEPSGS